MELSNDEKMALNMYADESQERTIRRLCIAAAFSPRETVKKMLCGLADKLQNEDPEKWMDHCTCIDVM